MYDAYERGTVYAGSDTVSVRRPTQSRWFLGVRRATNLPCGGEQVGEVVSRALERHRLHVSPEVCRGW